MSDNSINTGKALSDRSLTLADILTNARTATGQINTDLGLKNSGLESQYITDLGGVRSGLTGAMTNLDTAFATEEGNIKGQNILNNSAANTNKLVNDGNVRTGVTNALINSNNGAATQLSNIVGAGAANTVNINSQEAAAKSRYYDNLSAISNNYYANQNNMLSNILSLGTFAYGNGAFTPKPQVTPINQVPGDAYMPSATNGGM